MPIIKSLCVYCGSSTGSHPLLVTAAQELGEALAERGIRLIYGGARIGLMGALADATLQAGGKVIGIIPQHLDSVEVGHRGLTELKIVDSMHTRKKLMFDLADAFAILPGGLGTLDEFFEILTWRQLRLHDKPVVLLNIGGYWDHLLKMVDHIIEKDFARPAIRQHFSIVQNVNRLFDMLAVSPDELVTEQPQRF
ncbi:MAG TPA: TIGR00730 family Rossman fold protein [Dongiaceae bacterium]|jgi:hypothetical protein|nr:TIGR00730 family Rossman fold protein [Dongiaceae bacterium]